MMRFALAGKCGAARMPWIGFRAAAAGAEAPRPSRSIKPKSAAPPRPQAKRPKNSRRLMPKLMWAQLMAGCSAEYCNLSDASSVQTWSPPIGYGHGFWLPSCKIGNPARIEDEDDASEPNDRLQSAFRSRRGLARPLISVALRLVYKMKMTPQNQMIGSSPHSDLAG